MLSESVLAELLLDTPLRESLITLAWPSMDTAGRLQVIQAIYEQFPADPSCPTWLATLAMKDSEPIVRYWAAKRTNFRSTRSPNEPEWMRTTDEELYLFAEAASDKSEFIRFFATSEVSELGGYDLTSLNQLQRLLFIRGIKPTLDFEHFIDWLANGIEANVPEGELIDCCDEFFRNPNVIAEISRKMEDWDGYHEYRNGEAMKKGWLLVKKSSPRLAHHLASQLPTRIARQHKSFDASDLIGLSKVTLKGLLWRKSESNEIRELCEKIRKEPSYFPADVVAALEQVDTEYEKYGQAKPEESKEMKLDRAATERSRAIHEDIIELKQQFAEMREMLQGLGAAQSRKRGLFG